MLRHTGLHLDQVPIGVEALEHDECGLRVGLDDRDPCRRDPLAMAARVGCRVEQEAEVEARRPGWRLGVGREREGEALGIPDNERLALPLRRTIEAEEVAVEGDRSVDVPHAQVQVVKFIVTSSVPTLTLLADVPVTDVLPRGRAGQLCLR